jgi:hypothetical protein
MKVDIKIVDKAHGSRVEITDHNSKEVFYGQLMDRNDIDLKKEIDKFAHELKRQIGLRVESIIELASISQNE